MTFNKDGWIALSGKLIRLFDRRGAAHSIYREMASFEPSLW